MIHFVTPITLHRNLIITDSHHKNLRSSIFYDKNPKLRKGTCIKFSLYPNRRYYYKCSNILPQPCFQIENTLFNKYSIICKILYFRLVLIVRQTTLKLFIKLVNLFWICIFLKRQMPFQLK